jgi:hypothetical protein
MGDTFLYLVSRVRLSTHMTGTYSRPLNLATLIFLLSMTMSRNMHSRSYQVPLCRAQQRKTSFSPRTIVDWNRLPQTAVLSDSVESLKGNKNRTSWSEEGLVIASSLVSCKWAIHSTSTNVLLPNNDLLQQFEDYVIELRNYPCLYIQIF